MDEIELKVKEILLKNVSDVSVRALLEEGLSELSERERKILLIQLSVGTSLGMYSLLGFQAALIYQRVNNTYLNSVNVRQTVNTTSTTSNFRFTNIEFKLNQTFNLVRENSQDLDQIRRLLMDRFARVRIDILNSRNLTLEALGDILYRVSRILLLMDLLKADVEQLKTESAQIADNTKNTLQQVQELNRVYQEEFKPRLTEIKEAIDQLSQHFDETIRGPLYRIDQFITENLGPAVAQLEASVDVLRGEVVALAEAVTAGFAEVAVAVAGFSTALQSAATILGGFYVEGSTVIARSLSALTKSIEGLKSEVEDMRDELKKLPLTIASEVADSIVGESYYRFDSQTNYHPTVIFVFKLVNSTGGAGRSQVKLRFPKRSSEVTERDIVDLKAKIQSLHGLTYQYGDARLNFVSADRVAKTVMNVHSKADGSPVLSALCGAVGIPFDDRLISETTGNRRPPVDRRTSSIGAWTPRQVVNVYGPYRLFKAKFLVNGMSKPLILFEE